MVRLGVFIWIFIGETMTYRAIIQLEHDLDLPSTGFKNWSMLEAEGSNWPTGPWFCVGNVLLIARDSTKKSPWYCTTPGPLGVHDLNHPQVATKLPLGDA